MKAIATLFLCCLFISCGEYERLAIEKESQRYADSLFRAHRDSLDKLNDTLCIKNFDGYYNAAIDSIKEARLVKIQKLIEK